MAHDTHAAAAPLKPRAHGIVLPPGALDLSEDDVAARLRWARLRGEPAWLWPGVEPAAWQAGLAAVENALRAHLAGASRITLPVPADGDPQAVAIAAFTSGAGPLLGRWWSDGLLDTTPEVGAALALHLEHGRRRWTRLREMTAHAIGVLSDLGLRPIVLKGAHTAAAFYEEPGCRPVSDVDLAVAAGDWPTALIALERAGYAILTRQQRLGKVEMLPPREGLALHSLHLLHENAPIRLDLHAGIDRAFFGAGGLILGEPGTNETAPFALLHPAARVLREPLLLATLAAHASEGLHNLTLIRLLELVRVIRAEDELDWDDLTQRVGRRALRFLFPSLELAERLAPGTVPESMRRGMRAEAPPAMRRIVDGLHPATTQRFTSLSLEERMMWAGSPAELIGRLVDMAWPASAGSWDDVARIYGARFWRIARGRVSLDR